MSDGTPTTAPLLPAASRGTGTVEGGVNVPVVAAAAGGETTLNFTTNRGLVNSEEKETALTDHELVRQLAQAMQQQTEQMQQLQQQVSSLLKVSATR